MARLAGKVAIITGAASGIGAGTAALFAEHGARLVLVDRDCEGLAAEHARLTAAGAAAHAVCGDIAEAETITRAVAQAIEAFGKIDIVFNNAGIMPTGELTSFAEASWDTVMAVNVKAEMKREGNSSMRTLGSLHGLQPLATALCARDRLLAEPSRPCYNHNLLLPISKVSW